MSNRKTRRDANVQVFIISEPTPDEVTNLLCCGAPTAYARACAHPIICSVLMEYLIQHPEHPCSNSRMLKALRDGLKDSTALN